MCNNVLTETPTGSKVCSQSEVRIIGIVAVEDKISIELTSICTSMIEFSASGARITP